MAELGFVEERRRGRRRSKRMKTQNASFMSEDHLLQILIRLPHGRAAIRCSLVCKRWASLMSSDYFTSRFSQSQTHHHHTRYLDPSYSLPYTILCKVDSSANDIVYASYELSSAKIPRGIHYRPASSGYLDFLPEIRSDSRVEVRASFDDLLLISYESEGFPKRYCVCDPLTRSWNIIPHHISLQHPIGLWRRPDKQLGNYNAVCIRASSFVDVGDDYAFNASTFCSETGERSHRDLRARKLVPLVLTRMVSFDDALTSNGVLYFPMRIRAWDISGFLVLDPLENCESRFIGLPVGFRSGRLATKSRVCVGVVRARLRLSQLVKMDKYVTVKVWELTQGFPSAWVLVHDVKTRTRTTMFVLALHPNNGDVILVRLNNDVYMYTIGEDKYEKVGRIPNTKLNKEVLMECNFKVNSLVHTWGSGLLP